MSQNLQNFVKFQKFQLENLVDFEKCCKTHIYLQKSEPIQPKTSNILPQFCQPTLCTLCRLMPFVTSTSTLKPHQCLSKSPTYVYPNPRGIRAPRSTRPCARAQWYHGSFSRTAASFSACSFSLENFPPSAPQHPLCFYFLNSDIFNAFHILHC